MKINYFPFLLITFLFVSACQQIQPLQCKKIARFEVIEASIQETQMALELIIENPNAFTVDVKNLHCYLYKEDQQVGMIHSDSLMHFKAKTTAIIKLNTTIETKKIISNAIDMLLNANQTVQFKITGTAAVGRGHVFINMPIHYSIEKTWKELVR